MRRPIAVLVLWIVLAPGLAAQPVHWEPTAGPPSADAPAFVVAPSGALLIAQADQLARSTDEGDTWQHLDEPDCPERLRMQEGTLLLQTCDGWFRSDDDGQTWQDHEPLRLGVDEEPVRRVVRSAANGWFALAGDSLYRSGDDGATWQTAMAGIENMGWWGSPSILLHTPDDSVYVAVSVQLDGCTAHLYSWRPDSSSWGEVGSLWGCALALFYDRGDIYLGGKRTDPLPWGRGGLKRWTGRETWEEVSTHQVLATELRGDTLFIGHPQGVAVSVDRGASWTEVGPGKHMAVTGIHQSPQGGRYAVTSAYFWPSHDPHGALLEVGVGVLRWEAGRWVRLDPGIASGEPMALAARGDSVFALSENGLWLTADGGASWLPYDSTGWRWGHPAEMSPVSLQATSWGDVLTEHVEGTVHLAAYDTTFSEYERGRYGAWVHFSTGYRAMTQAVGDSTFVSAARDGCIHRSSDRGATWRPLNDLPCRFDLVETASETVWVASEGGEVWHSANAGRHWDSLGVVEAGVRITMLKAVSPERVFVQSWEGAYRSEDGGRSWEPLSEEPVRLGSVVANSRGQLFGTDGSTVWGSVDGAATWRRLDAGLPEGSKTWHVAIDTEDRLYVGILGRGVWRTSQPVVLSGDREADPPATTLGAPYPNPADDLVRLSFALHQTAHVRVTVYDVLGRRVTMLHDRLVPSGEHTATWSTADVPAGTYFARLEGAGTGQARPIVVVH